MSDSDASSAPPSGVVAGTEMRFYHLLHKRLDQALPELLEKCHERSWRAVVVAGSDERVEDLVRLLWVYRERSFLPHGSARDGNAADQAIWLTDREENPNGATVLVLTDGAAATRPTDFALICDLFDGNDPEAVAAARTRWKTARAQGLALTYWQQSAAGRWEKMHSVAAPAPAPPQGA